MMYIIRELYIAKPGSAGKFAKLMKEAVEMMGMKNTKVLLDFVTDFNKIVIEREIDSIAEFEKEMLEYKNNKPDPKMEEKMKGYTDLYQRGKREIYKIVD